MVWVCSAACERGVFASKCADRRGVACASQPLPSSTLLHGHAPFTPHMLILGAWQAATQTAGAPFALCHAPAALAGHHRQLQAAQCQSPLMCVHMLALQSIINGFQHEQPDYWLTFGNPWEIERPVVSYPISFYGHGAWLMHVRLRDALQTDVACVAPHLGTPRQMVCSYNPQWCALTTHNGVLLQPQDKWCALTTPKQMVCSYNPLPAHQFHRSRGRAECIAPGVN